MTSERRAPPASVDEALTRARSHGRTAASEALRCIEALLDAAALTASGETSEHNRVLGPLAATLEGLASDLEPGDGPASLLAALADALDAEIARWERRAREDADARAVLRAFLGLRELLWELGVRPPSEGPRKRPARATKASKTGPKRSRRVERVEVEG